MSTSLPDLPVELLCEIAKHLDNATLCALGSTCRTLNGPVFAWYFSKHGVETTERWLFLQPKSPTYILRAFRCALNVLNGPVDTVACYFHMGDCSDVSLSNLMEQVEDLRAIVGRLKKIVTLRVNLSQFQLWQPFKNSSTPATLGSEEWARALIALLATAMSKGCRQLAIEGGCGFYQLLEQRDASDRLSKTTPSRSMYRTGTVSTHFEYMLRILGRGTSSKGDITSPEDHTNVPSPPPLGLRIITLGYDMSFTSAMIDWTIQTLTLSAETLVELHLSFPPLTPSSTWHKFAETVFLPYITNISIWGGLVRFGSIESSDIALFLARHPSIRQLNLQGVPVPMKPSLFPNFQRPILPNLVCLEAHPFYVNWIFGEKNQCSKLNQVVVLADTYSPSNSHPLVPPYDYSSLDCALEAMENCPPSANFGFHFTEAICLVDWFQSQVDLRPGSSILSRCPWRQLTVQFPWLSYEDWNKQIELFIRWVSLFPHIECLVWKGYTSDKPNNLTSVSNLTLLNSLAPQLKKLTIAYSKPICIRCSIEMEKTCTCFTI